MVVMFDNTRNATHAMSGTDRITVVIVGQRGKYFLDVFGVWSVIASEQDLD